MKENKYDIGGDVVELGDTFFDKAQRGAELDKSNPTIAKLIDAQKTVH